MSDFQNKFQEFNGAFNQNLFGESLKKDASAITDALMKNNLVLINEVVSENLAADMPAKYVKRVLDRAEI